MAFSSTYRDYCTVILTIYLALIFQAFAHGQNLPPGRLLMVNKDDIKKAEINDGDKARLEWFEVKGMPFDKAMRVETLVSCLNPADVELLVPVSGMIEGSSVLFARFYIRTVFSKNESNSAQVFFGIKKRVPNYNVILTMPASASGTDWVQVDIPFTLMPGFANTPIAAVFLLGYHQQAIEIGGFELYNYGNRVNMDQLPSMKVTYKGRESDAPWRIEAERRIQEHRTAHVIIKVADKNGEPIENAKVNIELINPKFKFGTSINNNRFLEESIDGRQYRANLNKYFNASLIANDFKWFRWDIDSVRNEAIRVNSLLREMGHYTRGHAILWDRANVLPSDIQKLKEKPEKLQERVAAHVQDISKTLKGAVGDWDVVNEPVYCHEITGILGWDSHKEWFKIARRNSPGTPLFVNEAGIEADKNGEKTIRFREILDQYIETGVDFDGIGFQSHFGSIPPNIPQMAENLLDFVSYGKKMLVTEFDTNISDEDAEADFTRDFLTLIYSIPQFEGFYMWGFWNGQHWRGHAPLFRIDWSLKKAGEAYRELVLDKWRTKTGGATDKRGAFQTIGHLGQYHISVENKGVFIDETKIIDKETGEIVIIFP